MKNVLSTIGSQITNTAGRAGLIVQKKSPEILLGVGIVCFIGTVVTACKATLSLEEIFDQHQAILDKIEEVKEKADENNVVYDEETVKKHRTITTVKTVASVTRAYAPAIGLGMISIGCILSSRNIMQKRYLGVVAAYNAVFETFHVYRQRVIEEAGEAMDRHYRYGTNLMEITNEEVDEKGKKKPVKEIVENQDNPDLKRSGYEVYFDESNKNWDPNASFNKMFLRAQQNMANDILRTRGHIFLNEVYDMLGFDQIQEGCVIGWVKGLGDDYVDIGLDRDDPAVRRFINGKDNVVMLDFNHDGVIWDKI